MFRGNMIRWACVVATSVMVVSGCDCPGPNPPASCTDTTITFETPTADQTVDSPFDVSIIVKNADGTAFDFERAELSVSDGGAISATSVSGNRATFTGVPGTPGPQSLVATIAQGTCSKSSAPHAITVRSACTNAQVSAVSFPQDTRAPLGLLNATELPSGTALQVQVDAMCETGVQVRIKRNNVDVGALTSFSNGRATISLPGVPMSDSESVEVFAELVRGTTAVNTPASNPQAIGRIQISRARPSCSLPPPPRCFGPNDDADTVAPGFQLRVTGSMDPDSDGTLGLIGSPDQTVTPSAQGDVSADFTLTSSGNRTATLTCVDGSGNTNLATAQYCVDFDPPMVSITSPASVDGGATMVVSQSPLLLTLATDAENGSGAEVRRDGVPVGTGVVTNGMATLAVPFGSDGNFVLTVEVTDLAGNVGTASLNVTVSLSGCGAAFSRPGACAALLTRSEMPTGTYSFQTTSRSACANQPAALFRADVLPDGGAGAEVAAGTATLTGAGIANFPPLTLTSGDYLFRGEVTNVGPDAGVSLVSCQVTVDLEGPAITNPIVPANQTFATINAAQDTQSGVPGVQRVLAFSARVPVNGRVDVCTTQALNPNASLPDGGFAMRPTSPECGAGWFVLHQGATSPATGFTFPDGSYELKIVVVGGGLAVAPSSPPVAVLVDGVRPCVNGMTRDLPQDSNNDSRLNIAELGGAQPVLSFNLGCGDVSAATLSATAPVTVRDIVGGAVGAVRPSTAVLVGTTYRVTLTGPYTAEADLELFVELTDAAGNRNLLQMTNDPSSYSLRVDPTAPACNITAPSAPLLGASQVPGGDLDVIVATSGDVGANGVNVTFTGQAPRSLTPALSQAQTTYALTGDNTYTIGATCTDASGNAANATPRSTRVDLVPPTCGITSPANPAVSGVNDISTTVAVTGVNDGDTVTITSSVAGITNNLLTVASGSATRVVRYPNGVQMVTASINDAAGNPCVAPSGGTRQIQLTVSSTSCNLDFASGGTVITNSNGSWVNRATAANPSGTSPVTVAIGGVTSDCGMGRNVYLYQGPPLTTPTGTPQVTNAFGAVSFAGTSVSEGQQWTMTIDNGAGVLTHRSFTVSFAAPSIASIGIQRSATVPTVIAVAPNAALTFGAAAGNRRVETATASELVFADLDGATSDAQFQLTLTGVDGARVGTMSAQLDVLEGTTPLMSTVAVNSTPFTPSLSRLTLLHRSDETPTTLVIRVTSPAGNVFTSIHPTVVDVIAPAAPSITRVLSSARAATVDLSWMPSFDDDVSAASGGLTGGTPAAGYDLRWTTSSVPSNNAMMTEADFFGSSSTNETFVAWTAGGINRPLTLPPLNDYRIAVRARDEVGNYSTFSQPPVVSNLWTSFTLTGPASSAFGASIATEGSLNGDTVRDLVVGAPSRNANVGTVSIFYGGANLQSTAPQEIAPADGRGGRFGSDVSTRGNAIEVGTEGLNDLLVAAADWYPVGTTTGFFWGRAFLYPGAAAQVNTTQFIEFRADAAIAFAVAARIVRDIDGDGFDEVAIASQRVNTNQGRLYIFRGRTLAQWMTARTAMDSGGTPYVPVTQANWVLEGPTPATNSVGQNRDGITDLDLDGNGAVDGFTMATSRETLNRLYLYTAAAVNASNPQGAGFVTQAVGTATPLQALGRAAGTSALFNGFGRAAVGGQLFAGAGWDLAVTYAQTSSVFLYGNLTASGFSAGALPPQTATAQIVGTNSLGRAIGWGQLNSDSEADLVVGEGGTTDPSTWILFQVPGTQATPSVAFDANVSSSGRPFNSARLQVTGTSGFGTAIRVADVIPGDSQPELIVADDINAQVRIWR